MSRRTRSFSKSRGPKNNVWTAVVFDDVVISTTVIETAIVAPGDWQPSSGVGFEHATLLRIRGWLSLARNDNEDVFGATFLMIYVTDADDPTNDPSLAATYSTEDVIWSSGIAYSAKGAASVEAGPTTVIDVDVKAMRKINSAQQVRIALVSSSASFVIVSGVLRGLVRKSS